MDGGLYRQDVYPTQAHIHKTRNHTKVEVEISGIITDVGVTDSVTLSPAAAAQPGPVSGWLVNNLDRQHTSL